MAHDVVVAVYQNIDGVFQAFVHGVAHNVGAVQFFRNPVYLHRVAVLNGAAPALEQVPGNGDPAVLLYFSVIDARAVGGDQRFGISLGCIRKLNRSRYLVRENGQFL